MNFSRFYKHWQLVMRQNINQFAEKAITALLADPESEPNLSEPLNLYNIHSH